LWQAQRRRDVVMAKQSRGMFMCDNRNLPLVSSCAVKGGMACWRLRLVSVWRARISDALKWQWLAEERGGGDIIGRARKAVTA
jgi:hypothetical protein